VKDSEASFHIQMMLTLEEIRKVASFNEVHSQVRMTLGSDTEIVDGYYVFVNQGAYSLSLLFEAQDAFGITCQVRVQHLDCHHAFHQLMLGLINNAHGAFAHQRKYLVALIESSAYHLISIPVYFLYRSAITAASFFLPCCARRKDKLRSV